jgi:hypothetical protein
MDTITHSMIDASSTDGGTIELTVKNLSFTVIPSPSLLTRIARKLKHARGHVQKWGSGAHTFSKTLDENPISSASIERDRNSGINIFRNVDLTVKPGQGTIGHTGFLCIHATNTSNHLLCTCCFVLQDLDSLSYSSLLVQTCLYKYVFVPPSSMYCSWWLWVRQDNTSRCHCGQNEWS